MLETGRKYMCKRDVVREAGDIRFLAGCEYLADSVESLVNEQGDSQKVIDDLGYFFRKHFYLKPIPEKEKRIKQEQELLDDFAKIALGKLMERCPYDQLLNEKGANFLTETAYAWAESMMKSRGKTRY